MSGLINEVLEVRIAANLCHDEIEPLLHVRQLLHQRLYLLDNLFSTDLLSKVFLEIFLRKAVNHIDKYILFN